VSVRCSVLQYVAMRCSNAVCCSVLQCAAVCCSVLERSMCMYMYVNLYMYEFACTQIYGHIHMLQSDAVYCCLLQCVSAEHEYFLSRTKNLLQCVAIFCSLLQFVACVSAIHECVMTFNLTG